MRALFRISPTASLALLFCSSIGVAQPNSSKHADILAAINATLTGTQAGSEFGIRIASAGDVNNDGVGDLVVGAWRYDNGSTDNGAAFVLLGPSFTNVTLLSIAQAGAGFGAGVGGAGDVNGDGFDDVLVGAPNFDAPNLTNAGSAYLYFGSAGAFDPVADATMVAGQADTRFGTSVSGVGDVNQDGFDDIGIGAPRYGNNQQLEGAVFVYFGGAGAFNIVADTTLDSNQAGATAGVALAAGDINGDDISDIAVGAPAYESVAAQDGEGGVLIYYGGNGSFNAGLDAIVETDHAGAAGGASLAMNGDVNGDGFVDLLVGAPLYSPTGNEGGAALLWFGGAGAVDSSVDLVVSFNQVGAQFGRSVAYVGDITSESGSEFAAGAPGFDQFGAVDYGLVQAFSAPNGVLRDGPVLELIGEQGGAAFGTSLAAGDIDGDGRRDLAIGAPNNDANNLVNNGAVFVYFLKADPMFGDGFEESVPR